MASIVAWLIGLVFLGLGFWILLLRFEGLVDRIWPHNMLIGQMTVDGVESKGHAELVRARFDHHFRRPVVIAKETGFLEVLTLDAPELFQQKGIEGSLRNMTVEVSGVDVGILIRLVNQLAQPDRWVIEGDFQVESDRVLLALRMRRGERLIRTWYLERFGNPTNDKAKLLEQLIDDAIFQLAYDFGNQAEQDEDLQKWREVLPAPADFPSRAAVAAYYEGRGALSRYYAYGDWHELDVAIERLRTLRGQMPEYATGLKLLAMALAEGRHQLEAIHVYDQLEFLLNPGDEAVSELEQDVKRRYLPVRLLKAIATTKLYTWQSAHEAIRQLLELEAALAGELAAPAVPDRCAGIDDPDYRERMSPGDLFAVESYATILELRAQTTTQLAYAYALYFSYLRTHTAREMFGNGDAPTELQILDPGALKVLEEGPVQEAKDLVGQTMVQIKEQHEKWIDEAQQQQNQLEGVWCALSAPERRKAELTARLNFAAGYGNYRMAELEGLSAEGDALVLGATYETRLHDAAEQLRSAEAAHPNNYQVLQLLGLVYAEPRRDVRDLSLAEQYIDRAILANRADYYGHLLLARVLLRRIANSGLDITSREMLQVGLEAAEAAVDSREFGGSPHLVRAQVLTMLLEIERDEAKRQELRASRDHSIDQAARFLPVVLRQPDVDLTWMRIVAATRQLGEVAEAIQDPDAQPAELARLKQRRFEESKQEVLETLQELIEHCELIEARWVAQSRVFVVKKLKQRAIDLKTGIEGATLESWRAIQIRVL